MKSESPEHRTLEPTEELPDFIRVALQTDEPGGFKLYTTVLNCIADKEQTMDRPVVRQAINSYVAKGLILKVGKGHRHYLKDLTSYHPPRITNEMYDCLKAVLPYLSKEGFRKLPFDKIRKGMKNPVSVYHFIGVLVEMGILESEKIGSGLYRFGHHAQVAVYQRCSYENGVLVSLDLNHQVENSEPVEPSHCHQETLDEMARIVKRLEDKLRISQQVKELRQTLASAGTDPDKIEDMLRSLKKEFSEVKNEERLRSEVTMLKSSMPYWNKYLKGKR